MTEQTQFKNPSIPQGALAADELQKILSIQQNILTRAVVSEDTPRLLDDLCLLAESFTTNAVATIMVADPGAKTLNVESAPSLDHEAIEAFNGLRIGSGSCGNAVFHNEPMYVCNTLEDARWNDVVDLARRFNIRSCFSFPIRDREGRSIGSFSISSFDHREPEGFHRAMLETCTAICGVILQRRADSGIRKQVLAERMRSMKLESLGVLAGGIAHDFNNLLASILGNVEMAATHLSPGVPKTNLEWAIRAAERASDLTQQLLTFSRGGAPIKKVDNIESIVRESVEFALRGSNVNARILGLGPSRRFVLNMDGAQIGQLIQNLVMNARQAMPTGGTIDIECSETRLEDDKCHADRKHLRIDVRDTGKGIDHQDVDRIFDPYYTTRPDGTGLGLSLCYSIAQNHGGSIEVSTNSGGSCFSVFLPLAEGPQDSSRETRLRPAEGKGKRVILMDDDDQVLRVMTQVLQELGYDVLPASDGDEVLRIYDGNLDGKIDLAILDLTVPGGMGGIETKDALRQREPGLKVIVASGYSADQVLADYSRHGFDAALGKPFLIAELKERLSEAFR